MLLGAMKLYFIKIRFLVLHYLAIKGRSQSQLIEGDSCGGTSLFLLLREQLALMASVRKGRCPLPAGQGAAVGDGHADSLPHSLHSLLPVLAGLGHV